MDASALNDDPNNDDRTTDEHSSLSTKSINRGPNEWKRNHSTDLIHGRHDTSLEAYRAHGEKRLEGLVGEKRPEEGGIETVGGRAAETNNADHIKLDSDRVPRPRWLFEHGSRDESVRVFMESSRAQVPRSPAPKIASERVQIEHTG